MLNPFKKYDVDDFPDTYVSLSEAQRHPNVVTENERRASIASTQVADDAGVEKASSNAPTKRSDVTQGSFTLEQLRNEIEQDIAVSGHDSAYDRKSKVINKAIQDIGMGLYQWELFVLCGFDWLADNLWLQGVALTLPSIGNEFGISESTVRFTTLSLFTGFCIGAVFWGVVSDMIGRRPAFNLTLFLTAVFGTAIGGANSWFQVCALYAAMGCGVGEFLPFASGNLLTLLSVWWPFGQLLGSSFVGGFIPNYSCATTTFCGSVGPGEACCTKDSNMGWRYLNFTMGAFTFFMFLRRFFLFHMFESPKFLLSRGRQREAVAAVRGIAHHNKTKTWLSEEILNEIGGTSEAVEQTKLSYVEILKRSVGKFSTQRIAPLFSYKRLAINTSLLWFIWAKIGMGYPLFNAFLPQYLSSADPNAPPTPTNIVYRKYVILSIVGCPGSVIACFTVNIKHVGRRGIMALATCLTGIFLFLFTISVNANSQLGFSSMVSLFQNIMYGVLYAYSPETFPAPNRGTGTGIASFFNRITGLCAPLVAIYGSITGPRVPIYVSGGLMLAAFAAMVMLPIETMGKQSL